MSEEQLKAFIAKVQADSSLQEQLKTEGADPVAIAKAAGFAITEAEVKAYQTRDLSDEELEGVAGGACATTIPYPVAGGAGGACATTIPYPDHEWGPAHTNQG